MNKPNFVLLCQLILVLHLLFGPKAVAEQPKSLTIYTEEFPPYNFTDNEAVVGINADIVRLLCYQAKVHCIFKSLPWRRAFKNTLEQPNSGLISTSRDAARENQFFWVGPLMYSNTSFYRLSKRNDIRVETLADTLN